MYWLVLAFSLLSANEPKPLLLQQKIEVKVGEKEIITSTDVDSLVEVMKAERPLEAQSNLRQKAIQALIDQTLVSLYLGQLGMAISDRDVDQRINSIRASNGIQTNEDFRHLLEKQGTSFDHFKTQLRRQMEQAQFRSLMARQIAKPNEKDLMMFYKNHQERYKSTPELELAECVIPFGSDPKAAEKKAKEFQAKPDKFPKCVKNFSKAPSAAQKGNIGKFQRGMLRDDLDHKIFALKQNDILLVPMPGAFQLIKIMKVRNLGAQNYEAVKEKIREELENELAQKEAEKTISDLKSKNFVQIFS